MRTFFMVCVCCLAAGLMASADIEAQILNQQISFPSIQLQNEEQIFYCPTDSNYILANWRDFRLGYRRCGIGRSVDGGATWSDQLNNLMMSVDSYQSDPTMTVDGAGNIYMCFLDYIPDFFNTDSSYVIFIKSADCGATWTGPYPVEHGTGAYFEDKQFITADRTGGPYDGNVYVGWARFPNPTRIMFARSTDGGVTFEDTLIVGPSPIHLPCGPDPFDAGQFTQPIVGSDGAVYVFWRGTELIPDECAGYNAFLMSKSTDGGQTFPIQSEPIFRYNYFGSADGGIDVYNCPAGDADISGGPYDGNIYISTVNGNDDDVFYHADVVLIKSNDDGASWSEPLRINDDPLGVDVDQFHPWLVVNDDGVIVTVFYDQRMDVNHFMFDVFGAYSFDGGETFTTNHRITDVSSNPNDLKKSSILDPVIHDPLEGLFDQAGTYHFLSPMAGKIAEYIGVTAFHDAVTAVWTDTRNGNQDVFSASYTIPFLEPRLFGVENGSYMGTAPDSLWWSTCWHEDDVSYRVEIATDAGFTNIVVDQTVSDNKLYSGDVTLPDNTQYFWRVKAYRTTENDSTSFSKTWSFGIDTGIPTAAALISPVGGEVLTEASPTFTWSATIDPSGSAEEFILEVSDQASFDGSGTYFQYSGISDTFFTMTDALPGENTYYWRINHADLAGNMSGFTAAETFDYMLFLCGDANGDADINVGDAVYIINYIFKGGQAPVPLEAADVNQDGFVNVGDAVAIINYIFKGGPAPCSS